MTYVLFIFSILLSIIGVIIINKISSKAQEVRNQLKWEKKITQKDLIKIIDDELVSKMEFEYLYALCLEIEKKRVKEVKNNECKFDNIKKALDNIDKRQINVSYPEFSDDTLKLYSNREMLKCSHLN